jgi:succinylglutamate-semialdehyde dehydrogenase
VPHAPPAQPPSDLIGGRWHALPTSGPGLIQSRNPAHPDRIVWAARPDPAHIDAAAAAARAALPAWSRWPRERRFAALRRFKALTEQRAADIASLITDETGKALWDSRTEAAALGAKVDITLDPDGPLRRVSDFQLPLGPGKTGRCWFRPHGVMAVIGPFNFPAHLPNGHIVPALAMGNTIILKPSDKSPAVGQLLCELLHEALHAEGAPPGVVNLVHGAAAPAAALVSHPGIDGILFTGSWPVGRRILAANLDRPGRIIALEMGGNNAAIVLPDADLKQAAIECVRSAFITTGQRCTCTRRLIVHEAIAQRFIPTIVKAAAALTIGDPRSEPPIFSGPIISREMRDQVLAFQAAAKAGGAEVLLESRPLPGDGWYLSPSLIRVDRFRADAPPGGRGDPGRDAGCDSEVFGPLLRVAVVRSLDEAIEQANASQFGLSASIFTADPAAMDRFAHEARAGCININTGTAGASSKLPFGGLGLSGNHRPAGTFSLDYCAYPVAGMVESAGAAQVMPGMSFDESWLR